MIALAEPKQKALPDSTASRRRRTRNRTCLIPTLSELGLIEAPAPTPCPSNAPTQRISPRIRQLQERFLALVSGTASSTDAELPFEPIEISRPQHTAQQIEKAPTDRLKTTLHCDISTPLLLTPATDPQPPNAVLTSDKAPEEMPDIPELRESPSSPMNPAPHCCTAVPPTCDAPVTGELNETPCLLAPMNSAPCLDIVTLPPLDALPLMGVPETLFLPVPYDFSDAGQECILISTHPYEFTPEKEILYLPAPTQKRGIKSKLESYTRIVLTKITKLSGWVASGIAWAVAVFL